MTSDRAILESLAGPGAVRDPDPLTDRISSILPPLVVEPATPGSVAAVLEWASREHRTVVIRGAGSRMGWGRVPTDVDLVLSTRGLNRVIAHEHGDLTTTVEAGVSLTALNETLARHGQCLPLDLMNRPGATIGGLLATNESGPWRHRYGTPRDLVIGIQIATPAGTIANAGGRVVKNVAGYDLSKLMTGSFGSLAAIVSATFKLAPVPRETATLRVHATGDDDLAGLVSAVMMSQLDLAACELSVDLRGAASAGPDAHALLLRCTSLSSPVAAQVADVVRLAGDRQMTVMSGAEAETAWRSHAASDAGERTVGDGGGRTVRPARATMLRASWLPADLVRALSDLRRAVGTLPARLTGRAVIGAGFLELGGATAHHADAINRLRESPAFGNVVIVSGTLEVKERVDVWGRPPSAQAVLAMLKQTFDPAGILNASRGPV